MIVSQLLGKCSQLLGKHSQLLGIYDAPNTIIFKILCQYLTIQLFRS